DAEHLRARTLARLLELPATLFDRLELTLQLIDVALTDLGLQRRDRFAIAGFEQLLLGRQEALRELARSRRALLGADQRGQIGGEPGGVALDAVDALAIAGRVVETLP